MQGNYSKFLTNLAGITGTISMSLLVALPSPAKEVLNPNPSIFSETPYNRSQRLQTGQNYKPAQPAIATDKNNVSQKNSVAQKPANRGLNPRPSIFDEPPYNRGSRTAPDSSTQPAEAPSEPATEVPTTETPTSPTTGTGDASQNVVAIAETNGSFTILTQALKAAGLVDTLKGQGPFTIFAPTDDAFKKLNQNALQELLKPENKEALVTLLTYHVVSGKVLSTDLKSGEVKSLQGSAIVVTVGQDGVTVNEGANQGKVIQADIQGSNGVIHAIDNVIFPPGL